MFLIFKKSQAKFYKKLLTLTALTQFVKLS